MVENRLYVGNLSDRASVGSIRARFETCGQVTNVELPVDRASGRLRGYAFVTMATEADARSAITQLDGVMFEEQRLRVNDANDSRDREKEREESRSRDKNRMRITSQFRERANMAYELEGDGLKLSIRIFHDETDANSWRIEAKPKGAEKACIGAGPTRSQALEAAIEAWRAENLQSIDWRALTEALATVRAL
jgi:RNA recognition motif-containing protein